MGIIMKKIIISSILAITACLTMVSQANAAPSFTKSHTAQVHHQKAGASFDNKYQYTNNKKGVSHHKSKKIHAEQNTKNKYQGKNVRGNRN